MTSGFSYLYHHRILITLRKLKALHAFAPYLMRKGCLTDWLETNLFKKTWFISKGKYLWNAKRPRLLKTYIHERSAYPFPCCFFTHGQRPYFSYVLPADMQCD